MKLNSKNYYSNKADKQYMSVSQYKSFLSCEAKTMAKLNGQWIEPENEAFLIGSYVHSWNDNTLEQFKSKHPKLFKKDGSLMAKYEIGNKMIAALENDKLVSMVREGEKEVIKTAELFGVPWKCMIDIYSSKNEVIADLKTTREIHKKYWNESTRTHQNFIEYYDYLVQMAVYCEIDRINRKSDYYYLPHIIAVSKEDIPDKSIVYLGTDFIQDKLLEVEINMDRIKQVKHEGAEPRRCGKCDYCKATKQLTKVIHYLDL